MSAPDPRTRSIASIGIVSIAVVLYVGIVYGWALPIATKCWIEPNSTNELACKAFKLILLSTWPLDLIFVATLIVLFSRYRHIFPKKISLRHTILLLPLIPAFAMALWGADWWGVPVSLKDERAAVANDPYGRIVYFWQMLKLLLVQSYICTAFVASLTTFLSAWRGERKLVFLILVFELIFALICCSAANVTAYGVV